MHKFKDKPWYSAAVAVCIGVILFVTLMNIGPIVKHIRHFAGYFTPVIIGVVIAYMVNPLAKFYERVFFGRNKEGNRHTISNILAFLTFIGFLVLILLPLIPQLIESITFLADNLDSYMGEVRKLLEGWGISSQIEGLEEILNSSGNLMRKLLSLLMNNIDSIISGTASVGKSLFDWGIAFILSIYIISDKGKIKNGIIRLSHALIPDDRYERISVFIRKCDVILEQFVTHNFLDAMIVGIANAVFMVALNLPYTGLISVVVALTNLIPTFGPIIGWFIGAFLLVLVKPWYALAFTLFTIVLQTLDAYVIKPKLFGDTLGVSGLLILVGVIVGGRMFGFIGILVAIPAVAILDMLYKDFFIVRLEARKKARQEAEAEAAAAASEAEEKKEEQPETE